MLEESIPFEYYLFIDSRKEEVSINCENIESFTLDAKSGHLRLVYSIAKMDWLGRQTDEMVQQVDEIDCAEREELLKVYNGVRERLARNSPQKLARKDLKAKP